MASDSSVIIVGGGIGGLTAGIALRQAGFEATVYERAGDLRHIQLGAGIHLWHNAMRALARLGLTDEIEAVGSKVERAEFTTWRGRTLAVWPVRELGERLGHPTVGVSRADLHPVLARALGDDALRTGTTCTGFEQEVDNVTVFFAEGRKERGGVLVGADGIGSAVRAQLQGDGEAPRYAGYTLWQGIVDDFPFEDAPRGTFRVVWGPGTRFSFYRVGGERLYWFAVANAPEGERDPQGGPKDELLRRYGRWQAPTRAILEATPSNGITRMDMRDRRPVGRWGEGRVTLLGDAAHPMTFNVGQGACQAIEDAVVLADTLASADDVPAALRAYEAKRIERTTPIVKFAYTLGAVGRWEHPVAVAARDRIMRVALAGPGQRRHEADMAYAF